MSRMIFAFVLIAVCLPLAAQTDKPVAAPSPAAPVAQPAPVPTAAPEAPPVVVKTTEAIHALVIPMKGSYMQHGDAFGQFFGHVQSSGLTPQGPPFGRYLSDPAKVAEADLVWEIGAPVGPDVKATAPFEIRDIPAALSATLIHQGSPDSLGDAWSVVFRWIEANAYRPAGPTMMMFVGEPTEEGMRVELRLPVEKAQ